ncbi:hypothetical protein Q763_12625 [Flavobacterium beibuense F44-8]|uniref:Tetratricopeptide repeat protein n=1 Tax=Flavobacterium beibuense F44-8 TaxID=1406840 RepID=A0A0A2LII8_9FLAO|nr:hypothetical protein [Flavobacterium beibuense]KGO79689.1 hypothetical protein Q763_12625 [Flavobacterium beibuense F44-8]
MRKFIPLYFIFFAFHCFAQSLETVTLIKQRSYFLNGGLHATTAGGKSRETIKVDLPPNTKSWYYSFYTAASEDGTELLNLGVQIAASIYGGTAGTSIASSIKVPNGSGAADIYILTTDSRDAFLKKQDNNWRFYKDISLLNTLQAVQYVDVDFGNSFYIGMKNPSSLTGIAIYIEVVALVEKPDSDYEKGVMYGNLGWVAFEKGDFDKCLELSNKALGYDAGLYYVRFNIALVKLLQSSDDCLESYIDAIASIANDKTPQQTLQGALQDVQNLKLKSPDLENINDIEMLLVNKLLEY